MYHFQLGNLFLNTFDYGLCVCHKMSQLLLDQTQRTKTTFSLRENHIRFAQHISSFLLKQTKKKHNFIRHFMRKQVNEQALLSPIPM